MNRTVLKVATFIYKPYHWFEKTGRGAQVFGFYGNLLNAVCDSLNLDYEVFDTKAWGARNKNGTWTASFGALQSGMADFSLCPTNPFAEHLVIAEQSPGLHPTELVILAGRISRFQTNAFGFINTFKPEVWLSLVIGVTVLAACMATAQVILQPEKIFQRLFSRYSFMLLGNIWAEGEEHPPPPIDSLRIAWISWYCGITLILMNAFAGQMKASMLFKPETARLESMRDLYEHPKVRVYIPKDSAVENIMKNHNEDWMLSLYQRVLRDKTIGGAAFIFDQKALRESVNSKAVVIASRVALAKVSKELCAIMPEGELYTGSHPISSFLSVVHLSRQMPITLRRAIMDRLRWLSESGVLAKWFADMAGGWTGCLAHTASNELTAVEISEVEGLFFVTAIGLALSIIAFIREIVSNRRQSR